MAAAIPLASLAIGAGTSIAGGISGKGARKKQEQMQAEQLALLRNSSQYGTEFAKSVLPEATNYISQSYFDAGDKANQAMQDRQLALTDYRKLLDDAISQRNNLYNQGQGLVGQGQNLTGEGINLLRGGTNYLRGAGAALSDLQSFYRPFMTEGARAIDRFLPSAQRTFEAGAPQFGQVNQAYKSASENIAEFAPRSGRVTAMNDLEVERQRGISDTFFNTRNMIQDKGLQAAFQGAAGEQQRANSLQSLGTGQGQLGLGTIGQGLNTIGQGLNAYGSGTQALATGGALAQGAFNQGQQGLAQALQAITQRLQAGQSLGQLGASGLGIGAGGGGVNFGSGGSGANSSEALGAGLQRILSNPATAKMADWIGGIFSGNKNNTIPGTDFNIGMGW